MKIVVIIIRTLLGLLLVFSSVAYFFDLIPTPELTGRLQTFNAGMEASGYLTNLVKTVELICGLALLSGYFVPLALLVFLPVAVNIFCVHLFIAPEGIPIALFVLVSTLFLLFAKRSYYKQLFAPK